MDLIGIVLVILIYLTIGNMVETWSKPDNAKYSFKIVLFWPILVIMFIIYEIHCKRK